MGDSYRPMFPPPPAKSDSYRPTSQRHSDSTSHRGPDTYRPSGRNAYRDYNVPPARDDFSFQPPPNAPRFPPASQQDIPQHPPRRRAPRGAGFRRGQYSGPVAAHDRALLRNNTLSRDEQFLGVADGALKFNDLGDSTSEDEDNGASDSAADQPGPDAKKPRNQFNQADGDSVPKWSNPDPYTALPPPDESLKKKKDVVQLIRKAKVDQEKTADGSNAVSQNVDFISLNFDDGGNDEDDGEATVSEHESPPPGKRHTGSLNDFAARPEFARAPVDAPKRPRAASPAPQKSKKRKLRANEIDGTVVEQWLPIKGQDSTPWCTIDHSRTADVGLWLHKEICDFYEYVRPHDFEAEIRKDLVDRIEKVIRKRHGSCRLMAFGSYAAGLYLPTADMDLVMVSNSYYDYGPPVFGRRTKDLHSLLQYLLHQGIAEPNGEVIPSAKVPIIKFIDHRTGLKVDMSFENMSGVTANKTFYDWSDKYPAMPKIVTLIKHFLLMRGLNEVFLGGIGGFTVTCLVTHLIASLPAVQSGNMDPSQHLGEILLEFFDLYGNKFNYDGVMLRMNPIKYEKKGRCGPDGKLTKKDRLCIVDPNNESNDISGGSSKIPLIFRLFSDAHRDLKQHMAALESQNVADRKHSSILGCIFAGDYSSFRWQRDHLRRIYENR
ncbi:hypothetical protein EJ05DRAFT_261387 [Pseudovirgaria hyperparasitica]|uniref:polynucleotide adenylyltransferase n=1 Tax=Pseudovirgaria hyperparasitica TaxID=470096 RepID=A0A6A6WEV4_9PEZI|nr:uncharacterized protein EJ05DRAFT_261387 [Pseudovirgaria hyperparasitica]KAF2761358.1 hypothetical protein EJ05DRAFT_261387 [Pseudovirgaria hyperparasitica]